jgi:hypothetical protein
VDHVAVFDQFPATTPYRVTGVVNVIPELWPALPTDVPVQDPAPAPVVSRKSTFVNDTDAAEIVRAVPIVVDWQKIRFTAEFPVTENAPDRVSVLENVTTVVLTAVLVIVSEMADPLMEVTAPEFVSITASSDAPGAVVSAPPPEVVDHVAFVPHAPPTARAYLMVMRRRRPG